MGKALQIRLRRQSEIKERREAGLCIMCGVGKTGFNLDGTASIKCEECKQRNKPKKKEPSERSRPVVNTDAFDVDEYDYRTTTEFLAYAAQVRAIVAETEEGVSTADIHRALGTERQHWTLDVLNGIENIETRLVRPVRYRIFRDRTVRRRPISRSPHIQILPSRTLATPDFSSIYQERR